jgi:hypothetical protein
MMLSPMTPDVCDESQTLAVTAPPGGYIFLEPNIRFSLPIVVTTNVFGGDIEEAVNACADRAVIAEGGCSEFMNDHFDTMIKLVRGGAKMCLIIFCTGDSDAEEELINAIERSRMRAKIWMPGTDTFYRTVKVNA